MERRNNDSTILHHPPKDSGGLALPHNDTSTTLGQDMFPTTRPTEEVEDKDVSATQPRTMTVQLNHNHNDPSHNTEDSSSHHTTTDTLSSCSLEAFVQQAQRVQTMMNESVGNPPPEQQPNKRRRGDEDAPTNHPQDNNHTIVRQLAHEKATQVQALQLQLQGLETDHVGLQSMVETLRVENVRQNRRVQRLAFALRVAQANATKARDDADTAETKAATLTTTLQELQAVVQETVEQTAQLKQSHTQILAQTGQLETDVWYKQVRLATAERDYNDLAADYQQLEQAMTEQTAQVKQWQGLVDERDAQISTMKQQAAQSQLAEQARQVRVVRLEQDWNTSQSLLVEATTAQRAAAEAQVALRNDLRRMTTAHQELATRHAALQDKVREDTQRAATALHDAQTAGQRWQLQYQASLSDNDRLRVEKAALEKQLAKLKQDKHLDLKTTLFSVTPESSTDATPVPQGTTATTLTTPYHHLTASQYPFTPAAPSLPPLGCCVVCRKPTSGLTKACQCGQNCGHKAHFSCLHKTNQATISGSLILCGATPVASGHGGTTGTTDGSTTSTITNYNNHNDDDNTTTTHHDNK